MPRNELRTAGMLQAAVIALVLAALFARTPAEVPAASWPYVLAGYGLLAATVPWLTGGIGRNEFSLALSAYLGVVFALPLALSAYWLDGTPYQAQRRLLGSRRSMGSAPARFRDRALQGLRVMARSRGCP